MSNVPRDPASNDLVISYLTLRKAVGFIGFFLPLVLAVGKNVLAATHLSSDTPGLQLTISGYYFTAMRNVFVGSLWAIGLFLGSYRGYARRDEIAGKLACLFALSTALFHTTNQDTLATWMSKIHFVSAVLLLLTLAYFSLCLFRKTDPDKEPTREKLQRNKVYAVCGVLILLGIIGSGISFVFRSHAFFNLYKPVFWCESLAIVSFGFSWLTKGEAIMKDRPTTGS